MADERDDGRGLEPVPLVELMEPPEEGEAREIRRRLARAIHGARGKPATPGEIETAYHYLQSVVAEYTFLQAALAGTLYLILEEDGIVFTDESWKGAEA